MRTVGCLSLLLTFIAGGGCTGSSHLNGPVTGTGGTGAAGQTPCDPMAPQPITVGKVIGIGQSTDGTLYVAAANGVFVSRAGTLVRQHVTGTGQMGSNEYLFTVQPPPGDGGASYDLLVSTDGANATGVALGPSGSRAFLGQTDAGVTALAVVAPSAVEGMLVVNTPNVISYVADVAGGAVLVETVPADPNPSARFGGRSIYYGPPNALAQRPIDQFQQTHSGNGSLTFAVGGTPYTLTFGNVQTADGGPLGTFQLMTLTPQGGPPASVTLRSPTPAAPPADLVFSCFGLL